MGYDEQLREKAFELIRGTVQSWNDVPQADYPFFRLDRLGGAMTNCMFICRLVAGASSAPPKVLLRIYGEGSDQFFSRSRELFILQVLSCLNVGPKLLGRFQNGRFEEYLDSVTLSATDLRMSETNKAIAKRMYEVHGLVGLLPQADDDQDDFSNAPAQMMSSYSKFLKTELWTRILDWYKKAMAALPWILENRKQYRARLENFDMAALEKEIGDMVIHLSQLGSPVVFTHNDTQYGNILRSNVDDEILIIDFEYSCYNYRGFDIANHFCEWMANYHSAEPHSIDIQKFPTEQQQREFVTAYLDERDRQLRRPMNNSAGLPLSSVPGVSFQAPLLLGPSPSLSPSLSPMLTPQTLKALRNQEIDQIMNEAKHFVMASHVMWGLWGLIQAKQSVIEFDYVGYAVQRLEEYRRWKRDVLHLQK